MNPDVDSLKSFIEKIRSLGFIQRLFYWKTIRHQLIDAATALSRLLADFKNVQETKTALDNQLSGCKKDLSLLGEQKTRLEEAQRRYSELIAEKDNAIAQLNKQLATETTNCKNLERQVQSLTNELAISKEKMLFTEKELKQAAVTCIELQQKEETRNREHSNALATLHKISEQVQSERNREVEEQQQMELQRLHQLKETWMNHQVQVKNSIRSICNKHTIAYAEQVPFKGEPDNALKICDEYIVFDAKSPAGDDTAHFFYYLKDQAEKAKKYAKQEGVKSDIFFVVPSNTLEVIKQNSFHLSDFNVYIISADCLEPVILCLKKIEAYEFAQQLSPEERENICRIIGQFAHLTKRRIQIDSFFARQFIELVYKCESNLPADILEKVAEFERSEKLNPPMEKRAKAILTKQLEVDLIKLETEIVSKGIAVEDVSAELNGVPLYKD